MSIDESNFEIEMFIKNLRKISCFSKKLNKKCLERLNKVIFLSKSIISSSKIVDDLQQNDADFVDADDIDEINFQLKQNIWCHACKVGICRCS